jgi:hypothetical protein
MGKKRCDLTMNTEISHWILSGFTKKSAFSHQNYQNLGTCPMNDGSGFQFLVLFWTKPISQPYTFGRDSAGPVGKPHSKVGRDELYMAMF